MNNTTELLNRRAGYVAAEINLSACNAKLEPVYRQTALRISTDALINGGSVHTAVAAGKRYIAQRVVRAELDRHESEPKLPLVREETIIGAIVFVAAAIVIAIEAFGVSA